MRTGKIIPHIWLVVEKAPSYSSEQDKVVAAFPYPLEAERCRDHLGTGRREMRSVKLHTSFEEWLEDE